MSIENRIRGSDCCAGKFAVNGKSPSLDPKHKASHCCVANSAIVEFASKTQRFALLRRELSDRRVCIQSTTLRIVASRTQRSPSLDPKHNASHCCVVNSAIVEFASKIQRFALLRRELSDRRVWIQKQRMMHDLRIRGWGAGIGCLFLQVSFQKVRYFTRLISKRDLQNKACYDRTLRYNQIIKLTGHVGKR